MGGKLCVVLNKLALVANWDCANDNVHDQTLHPLEMRHRVWDGFEAHLGYTMAAFNILARWDGLQPDDHGRIHLSIARFTI